MKIIIKTIIAGLVLGYALTLSAVMFLWEDEKGVFQITDSRKQLPKEFDELLNGDLPERKETKTEGYWRDPRGNYHFYRLLPSAQKPSPASAQAPSSQTIPSPDPLMDESWRGKPNPELLSVKVVKIISPDTIQLADGRKLKFSGVAFPEELAGNSELKNRIIKYQRDLLEGKTVQVLFDQKKIDEKGRLLGLVFWGTDVFVNADLVLKGYARAKPEPPNYEYQVLYQRLQDYAKAHRYGIWQFL